MSPIYATLLFWLCAWTVLLGILGALRRDLLYSTRFKLLFLPGLFADSVVRTAACIVTGTSIQSFANLGNGYPYFQARSTPTPWLLGPLQVALRLLGVYLLVGGASLMFPELLTVGPSLADWGTIGNGLATGDAIKTTAMLVADLFGDLGFGALLEIAFLYAIAALALATALTSRDLACALAAWLPVLAFFWCIDALGTTFATFSTGWFVKWWYGRRLWTAFSLLVVITLGVTLVLALIRLASVLRRTASKR